MDISLALLPWKVLWNLKMRTAEKIGVGIAMSLGLLWVDLVLQQDRADGVIEQEPPLSSEQDMSNCCKPKIFHVRQLEDRSVAIANKPR